MLVVENMYGSTLYVASRPSFIKSDARLRRSLGLWLSWKLLGSRLGRPTHPRCYRAAVATVRTGLNCNYTLHEFQARPLDLIYCLAFLDTLQWTRLARNQTRNFSTTRYLFSVIKSGNDYNFYYLGRQKVFTHLKHPHI